MLSMPAQWSPRSLRPACLALSIVLSIALAGCSVSGKDTLASDSDNPRLHLTGDQVAPALRLARASRAAGDLASAISLYRSVAATKPTPDVLIALGDTLVEAGSNDDAIDVYSRVDPKSDYHLSALLGLARVYLSLGDPTKARDYADQACAEAPRNVRALIARGVTLDILGQHDEAQASYRAALAVQPRNVAARNDLALSLALTGRFDEAIDIITPMTKSASATPRMRANLALIYGLKGDNDRAATLSRTDLDIAATEANLHFFDYVRNVADGPRSP
jgi:Flp pilus assembly protein TadD